jgi:hypothetical protein
MARRLFLPPEFNFVEHGAIDFDKALRFFDWSVEAGEVVDIDLRTSRVANFTAMSLLILYAWHLSTRDCKVQVITDSGPSRSGASAAWDALGASTWAELLTRPTENFQPRRSKPLMALRDFADSKKAIQKVQDYTRPFNVEYKNLLTYVLSELVSNALEHGSRTFVREGRPLRFPSLVQFSWYSRRDELQFLVADLGIGVKSHLEKAYPKFPTHADALRYSIRPQVSGTFGPSNMYGAKNNAGMGLYISSSILQRIHADMYLVSGAVSFISHRPM